jgi:hypothetical protein
MARPLPLALLLCLLFAACTLTPDAAQATQAVETPVPALHLTPSLADVPAPRGWKIYRNEELAFGFAFPAPGLPAPGEGGLLATTTLTVDPSTNIVDETVSVSATGANETCTSPLGEGFAPEDLAPEYVQRNSVLFLRQTRSGVAPGTASMWVAYSTARDGSCISLGYMLRTFDPANLDPTRFPTPPATVRWEDREAVFENIISTFNWLR